MLKWLAAALAAIFLLPGTAAPNTSGIVYFSYSDYESMGNSYTWTVECRDGSVWFTTEDFAHEEYGQMTAEADPALAEQLEQLYLEHGIAAWNGFDGYDPYVLDGGGFSLSITFGDGQTLYAEGDNSYPKGYGAFMTALRELLSPLEKECLEEGRQKKIAEGLHGELECVMVNFIAHGTSGRNSYEFFLTGNDVREKNFDVRVYTEDGEFFPEGEKNLLLTVDDSLLRFDEVRALIDRYDLIQWYGYEETAEDYNNAEWFQIYFGFDDGSEINAMGTEHPENYDAFRADFLTLMRTVVDAAAE